MTQSSSNLAMSASTFQEGSKKHEMMQSGKQVLQMDDLAKAMEEFGVALRRPPFLEDR